VRVAVKVVIQKTGTQLNDLAMIPHKVSIIKLKHVQ